MPIDIKQYDSAANFIKDDKDFTKLIGNASNADDRLRLKAYELYEDMYFNRPDHMRVVLRGEDDDSIEIYIPSAKKNIEAVNRYLAIDFDYQFDSGTEVDQSALDTALQELFTREQVKTKFNKMKRFHLIKGDALLHIQAYGYEKPGRRICISELKPEHYFPIEDFTTSRTMGCHIVDVIRNPKNSRKTEQCADEWIVRRQTYMREMQEDKNGNKTPTGRITTALALFELSKWDDRVVTNEIYMIEELIAEHALPDIIQNIPVYHWKNNPPPASTFGMSELAGVESIINAINQAATDEDLTLITQGLGVYWTDASAPLDENGNEVEWEIGPGSVVQVSTGANFGRVTGVSSVAPYHEHIALLDENMQQSMAVPDVAIGMVDVQAVESGIALQLKFGPLLAHNKEKEPGIQRVCDEFLDDLLDWLQEYEGIQRNDTQISSIFGDPMPQNKSQQLTDYLSIWAQAPSTLPVQWLYDRLNELFGWDLSDATDFPQALSDAKEIAQSAAPPDPFANMMMDANGNPIAPTGQPNLDQYGGQNGNVPLTSIGA